jgi:hypothetical protein
VEFVRINGNRVIRVEIAKIGKAPEIFTKDEVEGMMRTDGTPLNPEATSTRTAQMGDVQRDPDKQAPASPPSLRNPGETVPSQSNNTRVGVMKPVQFPKQEPDDEPNAHPASPSDPSQGAGQSPSPTEPAAPQAAGSTSTANSSSKPADKPAPPDSSSPPQ